LSILRDLSAAKNIIIIAGAPIRLDTVLYIGAFILFPNQTETIYTKQYLHDGEELYFVPGKNDVFQLSLDNESISMAICADITNRAHPIKAASLNSSIYLASLFYTPNGISEGYETLQSYAREFSMHVLMSNYGGSSYGLDAAGKSAFWNSDGELIGAFKGDGEGLIIVQKFTDIWKTEIINT
jgi:predicted amidohydrolase